MQKGNRLLYQIISWKTGKNLSIRKGKLRQKPPNREVTPSKIMSSISTYPSMGTIDSQQTWQFPRKTTSTAILSSSLPPALTLAHLEVNRDKKKKISLSSANASQIPGGIIAGITHSKRDIRPSIHLETYTELSGKRR